MNALQLTAKNVVRNRARAVMTIVGVALAVVGFLVLRTVVHAWTLGVDEAAEDRIATRHRVSFALLLPKRYVETVRAQPGVAAATYGTWFGGKDPLHPSEFIAAYAHEAESFLAVYPEIELEPEARARFLATRDAVLVGDVLAAKLGWKAGDRITLESSLYPGQWSFEVVAVYRAARRSVDRSSVYFRWDYLNDSLPEAQRDQIGWVVSRLSDASRSAGVQASIDRALEGAGPPTSTSSERALQLGLLGMFSAILSALDAASIVILGVMALILGNTIAMGTRERGTEYAVLRAIGFLPRRLILQILGEGALAGLLGGLLGLALAIPLVDRGLGRFLEENLGALFPYVDLSWSHAATGLGAAVGLGALAAVAPAIAASRQSVVEALRKVG